ncbi:DUF3592 domain-containing protein [Streptomyces sp. CG1]|uniref:DUF3592 domain-containing protein n=1 Tax=Streptomyces sp. CG1 TaxID=1287523 RepID=UPI0034E1CED4
MTGAGVPLLPGAAFLAIGLIGRRRARRLRQEGAKTCGTVVRLEARRDMDTNSTMYRPVVQWVTVDGRTVETVSPIASSTVGDLRPGTAVTVFYDPDDPKRMLIDGYTGGAGCRLLCSGGRDGRSLRRLAPHRGVMESPGRWARQPRPIGRRGGGRRRSGRRTGATAGRPGRR